MLPGHPAHIARPVTVLGHPGTALIFSGVSNSGACAGCFEMSQNIFSPPCFQKQLGSGPHFYASGDSSSLPVLRFSVARAKEKIQRLKCDKQCFACSRYPITVC